MAVEKRNGSWYIYFRPFKDKKIGIKLLNVTKKSDASNIESAILTACRSGDYSILDAISRETCIRMFANQKWEVPTGLMPIRPQKELTLMMACKLFLTSPELVNHPNLWRYQYALAKVVAKLGADTSLKALRAPTLKTYRSIRLQELAAPATVNWEMGALSRLFGVLIENDLIETNPVRLLKQLSVKSSEREVYLSLHDVSRIIDKCPPWYRPIAWTAYYTGMRRGEILGLKRQQVNLSKRLIYLKPDQTKEGHAKRIPIHELLVPILREVLRITSLETDDFFLIQNKTGVYPIKVETFKNCWPRACEALTLDHPLPRFHDLRHTWRTNARRSDMDWQIAESIMGHWYRGKTVNDRYGRIGDDELLRAIDKMTFDHGLTEIFVYSERKSASMKKGN